MTAQACERKLLDLLEEAWNAMRALDPEGAHLDMFATKDGFCVLGYSGPRGNRRRIIDGYKSPMNNYRFSCQEGK